MRENKESIEAVCPKCRQTRIVRIPEEEIPACPKCGIRMVIKELLKEGKSY